MKKIINIFKKIKTIIMKKEELEQQNADLLAVIQRVNDDNKALFIQHKNLSIENVQLKAELNAAIDRVRYLANQIKMMDAQKQASNKYSDNNRNY